MPPGEILIATGAFWINLDQQLRAFVVVCWSLTSLCHSNGHIETMPAREINPFTALTRIQLRAEIFSNIVYSSAATYFILVIVNVMDCFFFYRRRHKEGVLLKNGFFFKF